MSTNLSASSLKGTWPAIVTPFSEDSSTIDKDSLAKLIEFQIESKVNGIVVLGSTGEAQMLNDSEFSQVLSLAQSITKGRVPLMAGVGASGTNRAVQIAAEIAKAKYDGILLVAPPYVKPTQAGIIEHFRAVAVESKLPICAYNIPGRASCQILPATLENLAKAGIIIGLKDATASIENVQEVYARIGDRLAILSGEDSLIHAVMACGGRGVISASANIAAKEIVALTSAALAGDFVNSLKIQIDLLPLVRALFLETNPIPVKAALKLKNLIASDAVRLPLTRATRGTVDALSALIF